MTFPQYINEPSLVHRVRANSLPLNSTMCYLEHGRAPKVIYTSSIWRTAFCHIKSSMNPAHAFANYESRNVWGIRTAQSILGTCDSLLFNLVGPLINHGRSSPRSIPHSCTSFTRLGCSLSRTLPCVVEIGNKPPQTFTKSTPNTGMVVTDSSIIWLRPGNIGLLGRLAFCSRALYSVRIPQTVLPSRCTVRALYD